MELYFINNGINYFDGFFFFGFLMFDDSLYEWIGLLYIVYVNNFGIVKFYIVNKKKSV